MQLEVSRDTTATWRNQLLTNFRLPSSTVTLEILSKPQENLRMIIGVESNTILASNAKNSQSLNIAPLSRTQHLKGTCYNSDTPALTRGTSILTTTLALTACGNGTSEHDPITAHTSGQVVKGPLENAFVFADISGDGIYNNGEPFDISDADGNYSLFFSGSASIISTTGPTTIDHSTGLILDGVTLKAPAGSRLVTPLTTIIEETGLPASSIALVLGLPNIDILSFNPYAENAPADDALRVEKLSQQVLSTIRAISSAAEGAGLSAEDANAIAINAVSSYVGEKTIYPNANNVNFASTNAVFSIFEGALSIATSRGAESDKLEAVKHAISAAVANVNTKIAAVSDLNSSEGKATFAVSTSLASQAKAAANEGNAGSVLLNDQGYLYDLIKDLEATIIEITGGDEESSTNDGAAPPNIPSSPNLLLYINLPGLRSIKTILEADLISADSAIQGFYNDDGGLTDRLSNIDLDGIGETASVINVSNAGIEIVASNGYKLILNYDGFSPATLEELEDVIVEFFTQVNTLIAPTNLEGILLSDLALQEIGGQFNSIEVIRPGVNETEVVVVRLSTLNEALIWERPIAEATSVDTFIVRRDEDLDVIHVSAQRSSTNSTNAGDYTESVLRFEISDSGVIAYIGAEIGESWENVAHIISLSIENLGQSLNMILDESQVGDYFSSEIFGAVGSISTGDIDSLVTAISGLVSNFHLVYSQSHSTDSINDAIFKLSYSYDLTRVFTAEASRLVDFSDASTRQEIEEAILGLEFSFSESNIGANILYLYDESGILLFALDGISDSERAEIEERDTTGYELWLEYTQYEENLW